MTWRLAMKITVISNYEVVSDPSNSITMKSTPCSWVKPGAGTTKINVDGSFVNETGQASAGVIARNADGEVVFSAARMLDGCSSAEEAELEAIKDGVLLAEIWVEGPATCETDCAEAVKAINDSGSNRSALCHLINDIKERMASSNVLSISYIKRGGNGAAHSLAAQARISNSVGFWLNSVPVTSEPLVREDCNLMGM